MTRISIDNQRTKPAPHSRELFLQCRMSAEHLASEPQTDSQYSAASGCFLPRAQVIPGRFTWVLLGQAQKQPASEAVSGEWGHSTGVAARPPYRPAARGKPSRPKHLPQRPGIRRAPTGPTSGGAELRTSTAPGSKKEPGSYWVRARGCDRGGTPRRPSRRDSAELEGPSERPEQTASPRPGAGPWAARGRAGRRSAGRCPVTGPDSAKSRRGGSSLSAPAAVALTSWGDHGCVPHRPARSLAVPAAPCVCQLRARPLRRACSLSRWAAQSVASSGRRLASLPGPRPLRGCPLPRLLLGANSPPACGLLLPDRRPSPRWRVHGELHVFSNPHWGSALLLESGPHRAPEIRLQNSHPQKEDPTITRHCSEKGCCGQVLAMLAAPPAAWDVSLQHPPQPNLWQ